MCIVYLMQQEKQGLERRKMNEDEAEKVVPSPDNFRRILLLWGLATFLSDIVLDLSYKMTVYPQNKCFCDCFMYVEVAAVVWRIEADGVDAAALSSDISRSEDEGALVQPIQ